MPPEDGSAPSAGSGSVSITPIGVVKLPRIERLRARLPGSGNVRLLSSSTKSAYLREAEDIMRLFIASHDYYDEVTEPHGVCEICRKALNWIAKVWL